MSYYVPARWRTGLHPAPDVTRVLGADGNIWLVVPVRYAPGDLLQLFALLETNPAVSQQWFVDPDATFILAVPTHEGAVAMLLRGFPSAEVISWEMPD